MDRLERILEKMATAAPPTVNVNVVMPDAKKRKSAPDTPLNDDENKGDPVETTGYPRPYTS